MDEKDDQIPTAVCLTECSIHIFTFAMPFLDETKIRRIIKNFYHLILLDMMLVPEFINNVFKPDKARDIQRISSLLFQTIFILRHLLHLANVA